jgi:hypothetical protein
MPEDQKLAEEEALRGPWVAVLCDDYGDLLTPDDVNADDGSYTVEVVRDSAAPKDGRMPGSYHSGDVLYSLDDLFVDDEDPSVGVWARWTQAQAVAEALNARVASTEFSGAAE